MAHWTQTPKGRKRMAEISALGRDAAIKATKARAKAAKPGRVAKASKPGNGGVSEAIRLLTAEVDELLELIQGLEAYQSRKGER